MRLAVMNFVSVVIDETRDSAVGSHRPRGPDVQESRGIEIQRIRVLPVSAEITAEVFAVWSGGYRSAVAHINDGRWVAAGLLRGELPGLAFVERIRSNPG